MSYRLLILCSARRFGGDEEEGLEYFMLVNKQAPDVPNPGNFICAGKEAVVIGEHPVVRHYVRHEQPIVMIDAHCADTFFKDKTDNRKVVSEAFEAIGWTAIKERDFSEKLNDVERQMIEHLRSD